MKCIFCGIVAGKKPSYTVYKGHGITVFLDILPVDKGHLLIVPDEHYDALHKTPPCVAAKIFAAAAAFAKIYREVLGAPGVNVMTNDGKAAGQEIFHVHVHVIPRWEGGGFMRLLRRHKLTRQEAEEVIGMLRPHLKIVEEYLENVSNC